MVSCSPAAQGIARLFQVRQRMQTEDETTTSIQVLWARISNGGEYICPAGRGIFFALSTCEASRKPKVRVEPKLAAKQKPKMKYLTRDPAVIVLVLKFDGKKDTAINVGYTMLG